MSGRHREIPAAWYQRNVNEIRSSLIFRSVFDKDPETKEMYMLKLIKSFLFEIANYFNCMNREVSEIGSATQQPQ